MQAKKNCIQQSLRTTVLSVCCCYSTINTWEDGKYYIVLQCTLLYSTYFIKKGLSWNLSQHLRVYLVSIAKFAPFYKYVFGMVVYQYDRNRWCPTILAKKSHRHDALIHSIRIPTIEDHTSWYFFITLAKHIICKSRYWSIRLFKKSDCISKLYYKVQYVHDGKSLARYLFQYMKTFFQEHSREASIGRMDKNRSWSTFMIARVMPW